MATIVAHEPMALSDSATRKPATRGERGEGPESVRALGPAVGCTSARYERAPRWWREVSADVRCDHANRSIGPRPGDRE
jgi:hypothetical protein